MSTLHGKYATFFALFNRAQRAGKLRHTDHHDLLKEETGKSSLKDLTPEELKRIEVSIQELVDPIAASANRQRRKIIAILAARGMAKDGKPDMAHIYAWVLKYGYLHKPMNNYTQAELPRLVSQAEGVQHSDFKASTKHG